MLSSMRVITLCFLMQIAACGSDTDRADGGASPESPTSPDVLGALNSRADPATLHGDDAGQPPGAVDAEPTGSGAPGDAAVEREGGGEGLDAARGAPGDAATAYLRACAKCDPANFGQCLDGLECYKLPFGPNANCWPPCGTGPEACDEVWGIGRYTCWQAQGGYCTPLVAGDPEPLNYSRACQSYLGVVDGGF